jgi:formylglycine-generating enzyme required for sulfatase activity
MNIKKILSLLIASLLLNGMISTLDASGLQISKGTVITDGNKAFIEFQISWDLSWHNQTNWDAAWVFAKDPANGHEHLKLIPQSGSLVQNHLSGQPDPGFNVSDDQLGSFIYRSQQTTDRGSNNWTVRLEWDYEASEYSLEELPKMVSVYGIEMVYVPEGPFEAGDPLGKNGPPNAFFSLNEDSTGTYRVTSSDVIPVCDGQGSLCYQNQYDAGRGGDQKGPVPAEYPNGYDAFYLMKYKITQGQYADMLNTLSDLQTANRAIIGSSAYNDRGSIKRVNGKYITDNPYRTCNYLGWEDGALFADWAALRPYTELEYEKAARGPAEAVANEYAWGTTNIMHGDTLFNPNGMMAMREDGDEYIRGNANYRPQDRDYSVREELIFIGGDGGIGPLRVDIFESRAHQIDAENIREASGAGYYGAVGMTGELFERLVTVGNERGRSFAGSHGDGNVNYAGYAGNTLEDWPSRTGEGLALRARNYAFDTRNLQMANRGFGQYSATYRARGMGFRAARTANTND